MRRGEFITLIGCAAAWPVGVVAQQPAIPVIGYLSFRSANESASVEAAFREGLSDIGYSDGRSVHIAFRWAEGQRERLPALAAKAATKTIPIVFAYGADPVKAGIVANLNRPEENVTGITWFGGDVAGKRLALLHDIISNISTVGLLTDPSDPEGSSQRADAQGVASRLNLKLVIMNASTGREIDAAFATFAQQQVGAVVIGSNPFFVARREQIISLAARHRMPGIY